MFLQKASYTPSFGGLGLRRIRPQRAGTVRAPHRHQRSCSRNYGPRGSQDGVARSQTAVHWPCSGLQRRRSGNGPRHRRSSPRPILPRTRHGKAGRAGLDGLLLHGHVLHRSCRLLPSGADDLRPTSSNCRNLPSGCHRILALSTPNRTDERKGLPSNGGHRHRCDEHSGARAGGLVAVGGFSSRPWSPT